MNVLNSIVGWLPVKWQPYAKTIAAAVLALLTILSATVDGLPTWVTVVAAVLTAPVVFATPNLDPTAQKQDESVMPPDASADSSAPGVIEPGDALPLADGQALRVTAVDRDWSAMTSKVEADAPVLVRLPLATTPRPSRKGRVFIIGALVLLGIVELIGVFGDTDTISGLTADVFHTSTPVGRAIFVTAWIVFSGWYLWHIWFWGRVRKHRARHLA